MNEKLTSMISNPNADNVEYLQFIHSDEKEHFYYSAVNTLSGDRLSGFDGKLAKNDDYKKVMKKIKSKCKILFSSK